MRRVAIMTDSISAIPLEMAQKYGIRVVPLHAIMDGKDYPDTEITKADMERLYARLKEKGNLPTTSAPSAGDFLEAYQELSQRVEAILFISLTSVFSATYGAAIQAKEIVREKLPQITIEVIDSRTTSSGVLLIVLEAARAAAQGKDLKEIIEITDEMIPQINLLSTRDTLFYLDKGGLIFEAKSWAEAEPKSSFRAIVQIDASTGGKTKPVARAKTKKQIMEKMLDIAKGKVGGKKLHAAIVHTNVPDQAEQLKQMMLSQFQCGEFYVAEALGATAVKNGRGLIDFAFYSSD